MVHPPDRTFRETLAIKYSKYGQALWEPSPGGMYDAVEVGDVGFIRDGCFHRLFNILLPGDHPSHQNFGVPESHQPLRLKAQNIIRRDVEGTMDFCSGHVSLSRRHDEFASGPNDDRSNITVSCAGKRGALLSLPVPAQREDTIAVGDFGRWMVRHIHRWFAFAKNFGLGIDRMQDIILVTGCHRAKSWVNVAFSEGSRDAEASFVIRVSEASGVNVEQRLVRGDVVLKLGPNGEGLPENQCIFVRGFRVKRIWPQFLWSQMIPASASFPVEPGPNIGEYEYEPEPAERLGPEPIATSTDMINYQDPLHVLLQYIAEKAPHCNMALVHDDDLACIADASLDGLEPDLDMEHLRVSGPEIQQRRCDSLPDNESGARAVVHNMVGGLFKNEFPPGETDILSVVPIIDHTIATFYKKMNADGVVVFNGLFLSIVASFIMESHEVLPPRPGGYVKFFWAMSLMFCTTSSISAILMQQNAREARRSQTSLTPGFTTWQPMHIRSLYFGIAQAGTISATHLYLSILCFHAGLVIFLFFTTSKEAVNFVSIIVRLIGMGYVVARLLRLYDHSLARGNTVFM